MVCFVSSCGLFLCKRRIRWGRIQATTPSISQYGTNHCRAGTGSRLVLDNGPPLMPTRPTSTPVRLGVLQPMLRRAPQLQKPRKPPTSSRSRIVAVAAVVLLEAMKALTSSKEQTTDRNSAKTTLSTLGWSSSTSDAFPKARMATPSTRRSPG
jgi:hypothetical protein